MKASPLPPSHFRRLALIGVISACATLAPAQNRAFTSTDGHAIQAELVAVFGDFAVLRLNSSDHEIPLSHLIEGDGDFIRAWTQENANGPTDLLAISFEEKMIDKEEQKGAKLDRAATWTAANRIVYHGPEALIVTFNRRNGLMAGRLRDPAAGIDARFGGALLQQQGLATGSYQSQGQSGLFRVLPR